MERQTLLESLDDAVQYSKLFFQSKFDECSEKLEAHKESSVYHRFAQCFLLSAQGVLTFDKNVLATAINEIETCLAVYSNKYRKKTSGLFASKNYDQYSDEEVSVELLYNVLLNLSSLLSVVHDQTLSGFVKAAYRMTTAYMGYRESMVILKTRNCWSHPRHREHFEALLKLFSGSIELVIAYMPPKLSRLLELIGFSGQFEIGMHYLETSFSIKNTFGSVLSSIILNFHNIFVEYFYGLGYINVPLMKEIYSDCPRNFPESVYTALSKSLLEMADSRFDDMVNTLNEVTDSEEQPQYIVFVACWLKSWGYAFQCDWSSAHKCMKQMLNCPWGPALIHYIYGAFLFSDECLEDETERDNEVSVIFKKVPTLRMKIGGRKLFHDDFVVKRSKKYFGKSRKYILPVYELFYIWNYFSLISKNKKSMETILGDIESKLREVDDTDSNYDDYSVLLFLKAVVLKHSQQQDEAYKIFIQIIENKKEENKRKTEKCFVVPHSMYEIALIHKENGNIVESKKWIQKAKKTHGYVTERLLSFRCDLLLHQFAN